jgi:hypothetical protein
LALPGERTSTINSGATHRCPSASMPPANRSRLIQTASGATASYGEKMTPGAMTASPRPA